MKIKVGTLKDNTIDKPLARQTMKKEKKQIIKIRIEKGTLLVTHQGKNEYYKQRYAHKFNNLDVMGKFLEHKLPQFIQEERYLDCFY